MLNVPGKHIALAVDRNDIEPGRLPGGKLGPQVENVLANGTGIVEGTDPPQAFVQQVGRKHLPFVLEEQPQKGEFRGGQLYLLSGHSDPAGLGLQL